VNAGPAATLRAVLIMVRMRLGFIVAGSADCPAGSPASTDLSQCPAIPLQPPPAAPL
jgi:hypothetical protein